MSVDDIVFPSMVMLSAITFPPVISPVVVIAEPVDIEPNPDAIEPVVKAPTPVIVV